MSADNGIYVASFPTTDGSIEYRVAYASAIDNVHYGDVRSQDLYRASIFGTRISYDDRQEALLAAHEQAEKHDYLEYGVSEIAFNRPLLDISEGDLKKEIYDMYRSYAPKPAATRDLSDVEILMDTLVSGLGDADVRNILLALREKVSYKFEAQLLRAYHTLQK